MSGNARARAIVLVFAVVGATIAKLAIALTTMGTNDVITWTIFAAGVGERAGIDMYRHFDGLNGQLLFNHPPFMIRFLQVLDLLARTTGLPFQFWLRLPAILADAGSLILVWRLVAPMARLTEFWLALILMAVAPASIMISGFHGNTDSLMIFLVLLSVYLLSRGASPWTAGVVLGMGLNIKVVPLLLLPVLVLSLPGTRQRVEFLLATMGAVLMTSLPFILQDPVIIARRVLGYGSQYGLWGIARVLDADALHDTWINTLFLGQGKYFVVLAIVAASLWLNRRYAKLPLYLQCGFIMFLFLALSPGFGVQYLAWLVPWVVALGPGATLMYYATSGAFLFGVYTTWAQEIPWYFADARLAWSEDIHFLGWMCWLSVLMVLVLYSRAARCYAAKIGGSPG